MVTFSVTKVYEHPPELMRVSRHHRNHLPSQRYLFPPRCRCYATTGVIYLSDTEVSEHVYIVSRRNLFYQPSKPSNSKAPRLVTRSATNSSPPQPSSRKLITIPCDTSTSAPSSQLQSRSVIISPHLLTRWGDRRVD